MKYLVLVLIISIALFTNIAYATPSFSSQEVYDFSNVILIGKVISINSTFSPTHNLYEIKVEKFLKNQQDSDIVFAAEQKTTNMRLGNTVFNVNDRGLFFLMNYTIGYDNPARIFGIYPTSRLIDVEWDKCNIFEKKIPQEHWVFGGAGPMPKIHQGNNIDTESFITGKEIFISYDVFNHSPNPKNATYGIQVKNLDDPNSLYEFTEVNNSYLLEPCTPYKTLTWNFTPSKPGHYMLEFYDLRGSMWEVGFVVLDNAKHPTPNEENSGTVMTNTIDFQALEASKAKCTVLGLAGTEACSLESSLTLGITTTAIIGTVIATSMFTMRKRK
jgi:hypothetical protein